MYKTFLMAVIALLLAANSVYSDVPDDSYNDDSDYFFITEDFSGDVYPPPGWRIIQSNKKKTWEQSHDCKYGEKCAVIEGDPSGPSNERLISPPISCSKGSTLSVTAMMYDGRDIYHYLPKPFYLEI